MELRTIEEIVEAVLRRLAEPKLLTVPKVALLCNVDQDTVRDWITGEKLRAIKLGNRSYRIRMIDLNKFLEDRDTI